MNQFLLGRVRWVIVCTCSLFVMLLFTACSGTIGNGTSSGTITGSVVSVNQANHSATVSVNGQQFTINGLSDQQISQIQGAVGKTWSFQVSGNNGSYEISSGTDPQENDTGTPEANVTPEGNETQGTNETPAVNVSEPASLSYSGVVQSVNANGIAVKMPNGDVLSMSINNLTDRGDFGTGLPAVGQRVKVEATANADGSFTATKLDMVSSDDQANASELNTLDVQGVTTSAVGSGNVLHLKAGNKSFTVTLAPTTQVEDFTNVQSIASGQSVKVEILFNGATATAVKVQSGNN
jgi:uncharacterized protein DUF5666